MEEQRKKMKWILFWVFLTIYVIVTFLTILALFFNLGNLEVGYKSSLVATFIIETGAGIITLFYSIFSLKRPDKKNVIPPFSSEIQKDVEVVDDSPLGSKIQLNKPTDILGSYNGEIKSVLISKNFSEQYNPAMMLFLSSDTDYMNFRPTVVLQLVENPLIQLNMTLADYMDSAYAMTKEMQDIVGKRQVRVGNNIATQWYRAKLTNIMGIKVDVDIVYTQFQKIVVSDDLMGIITVSYADETKPKDIKILQDLLNLFGIKQ